MEEKDAGTDHTWRSDASGLMWLPVGFEDREGWDSSAGRTSVKLFHSHPLDAGGAVRLVGGQR